MVTIPSGFESFTKAVQGGITKAGQDVTWAANHAPFRGLAGPAVSIIRGPPASTININGKTVTVSQNTIVPAPGPEGAIVEDTATSLLDRFALRATANATDAAVSQ